MTSSTRKIRCLALALLAFALYAVPASAATPPTGGASAPGAGSGSGSSAPGASTPAKLGPRKSPPSNSHLPTPVITTARCYKVRTTRCAKDPHVVQATGELVLRGRNLRQGMTVYFPVAHASAGHQRALGALLRPTNHGLAVTIPTARRDRAHLRRGLIARQIEPLRPDRGARRAAPAPAPAGGARPGSRRRSGERRVRRARDVDLVPERLRRRQRRRDRRAGTGRGHQDAVS